MQTHRRTTRLLLIGMLAALLTGCAAPTAAASPAPTQTASPSVTPSPLPSSTATATATAAPTLTPTATLEPSPTPRGFYSLASAGFSLSYPANWEIVEASDTELAITDRTAGIVLSGRSVVESETKTADQLADTLLSDLDKSLDPKVVNTGQQTIGTDITAESVEMQIRLQGQKVTYWFLSARRGTRNYIFTVLGPLDLLTARKATLERVLSSIELFQPQLFGLDHNQTMILLGGDPDADSLDPAKTGSSAADYVGLLFSGLVRLTPDLQIQPELAESWQVSPDGRIYTFKLKPGIQFSSGTAITAQDVKDSWERAADPATKSTTAATYLGDIQGFKERLAGKAKEISGVKVIDEGTLQVTLEGPRPYFLAKLTYPTSYVVHESDVRSDPKKWMFKPDASGPYQVRDYKEGAHIIFERNPAAQAQPGIPYLVFQFNPGGAPISLFEAGELDIAPVFTEDVARLRNTSDPLHERWLSAPTLCTSLLMVDGSKPPLNDPQLRKALALSVDRATLVEQLSDNQDLPALAILPPAMPGFNQSLRAPEFDLAAAKAALQASDYAGKTVEITLSASGTGKTTRKDLALLVEGWKKALGIDVKVSYIDPADFSQTVRKEHGNLVLYSWCADYPDPENFLDLLFHTGAEFNVAGFSDAEIDRQLEQARETSDPAERIRLYQQVEASLIERLAAIPLYTPVNDVLVSARIKGYVLSPLHARVLPGVSIDPAPAP